MAKIGNYKIRFDDFITALKSKSSFYYINSKSFTTIISSIKVSKIDMV